MNEKSFAFALNQPVRIAASGETGHVIGRAEYTTAGNNYYVRYQAADGRATEAWWAEDALTAN
jgi:poly-gamma-glutamate capsule biosynthesis protein CapA/YwtB (metallophosphatase superfamily)